MAPEILHGEYNYKCDMWSMGVILYMLVSGVRCAPTRPNPTAANRQPFFQHTHACARARTHAHTFPQVPPFWGRSDAEIRQRIAKGTYQFPKRQFQHVSAGAVDLIRSLLCVDVNTRWETGRTRRARETTAPHPMAPYIHPHSQLRVHPRPCSCSNSRYITTPPTLPLGWTRRERCNTHG